MTAHVGPKHGSPLLPIHFCLMLIPISQILLHIFHIHIYIYMTAHVGPKHGSPLLPIHFCLMLIPISQILLHILDRKSVV